MKNGFEYNSIFNTDSSFTGIKFGYDRPVLEVELNEMQDIQNHSRKLLTNKICKSGIIELVDRDFVGQDIVFNPNKELNKIAIAPMKVMINGYEIHVCGNYKIGEVNSYIDIDLGEAPSGDNYESETRDDLVFLQAWLEEFDEDDLMRRYGHAEGTIIPNTIIDPRVGEETSHRMVLKWKIRTVGLLNGSVDFDRWEYGFGFENSGIGNFVPIKTDITNGINLINPEYDKVFANATHYMFKGCMFYGDNNLWVAGRPHSSDPSNTKDTEFVYALPLFRVKRRNKKVFTISNSYGSRCFDEQNINTRPDDKCHDLIYKDDIVDLRKTVIIGDSDVEYYHDDTLKKILTGELRTKSTEVMKRVQFGVEPISQKDKFNEMKKNIAFLDSFDRDKDPVIGNTPEINPQRYNITYKPSVTEWGMYVDGKFDKTYKILSNDPVQVNTNEGTIDFYICPNWNGFDLIEQNILTLYFQSSTSSGFAPFISIDKIVTTNNNDKNTKVSRLVIKRYTENGDNARFSLMNININNIIKNKIYHFRICWSSKNNDFSFYINGKKAGNSLDDNIAKAKDIRIGKIKVGNVESEYDEKMGFLIDELAIYNEYYADSKWNIPQDFKDDHAVILPSFNGIFRNFRSNEFEQFNVVSYVKTENGTTSFNIDAPYGTKFGKMDLDGNQEVDFAKVYCIKLHESSPVELKLGMEVKGKITGAFTNRITFTLNTTAINNYATFKGETLAIVYSLMIPNNDNIDDIPNKILKAEIEKVNNLGTNDISDISFNVENKTGEINNPREVNKLVTLTRNDHGDIIKYEPVRNIYNVRDTAYDFSTFRNESNRDFAFARLLEFYMEGNGTNEYKIKTNLYGYDVMYVRKVEIITNTIDGFEKIKTDVIQSVVKEDGELIINIESVVESGQKIKFELALAGITFDYNVNSKTYVGNVCKAMLLEFESTGDKYEYTIPLENVEKLGMASHGVLLASGIGYSYQFDKSEDVKEKLGVCYNNDIMQEYELVDEGEDSFGKPYIKINIKQIVEGSTQKVPEGNIVKIPVFVTYQPQSSDILSVWYNYNPYQGILTTNSRRVKRISNWKYFITTLSSSGANDKFNIQNSLNNCINRLPGGANSCSYINGQDINLKDYGMHSLEYNNYKINKNFIFINQTFIGNKDNNIDKTFFDLDTIYSVNKRFSNMQDDNIIFKNEEFIIYLPKNESVSGQSGSINRYCGMSCVVMNEFGDLYIMIVGDTNNNSPTENNFVCPTFGDIFMIPYRPSMMGRF